MNRYNADPDEPNRYGRDPDPWNRDEEDVVERARRLFRLRYAETMIDPSGRLEDGRRDVEEQG